MPIKPENRARYPKDWQSIVASIRKRSGDNCENCGVKNGELGGRGPDGKWHKAIPTGDNGLRLTWPAPGTWAWCSGYNDSHLRIVRIVLTVAHLNHTPEDCRFENLRHWCQRCHNRYDRNHRAQNARRTLNEKKGQKELFG